MNVYVKTLLSTSFNRTHELRIGSHIYTIEAATTLFGQNLNVDDNIDAKLPNEYDWYNYGKVIDFLHETSDGLQLWLFHKNTNPLKFQTHTASETENNNKKSNKSWW